MLVCGQLTFNWFSKSVSHSVRSIFSNVGLIGDIDIPKKMFPLAQVQEGLYKQAIVFLLLMVVL